MNITSTSNPDINGEYYYIRNAQGDITGLFDKSGVQVVTYVYDSWGKLVSVKDKDDKDITNDTNNIGYKNPYRYRGYRYDAETGLYYLNSRYYNAEWGRFINMDNLGGTVGELLSHNVFAYCGNNPVNRVDPSGHAWWTIGAVVGAVAGAVAGAVISYSTTGSVDWRYVAGGAAAGALLGAGLGYAAELAYGAIVGTGTIVAATQVDKVTKVTQTQQQVTKVAQSSSNPVINAIKNSTNVITKTNSSGQKVPYAKIAKISEEYKIIFRRDIGEFSHGDMNHFNIELQSIAGNIKYNVHLYVNEAMEIIERVDK